METMKTLKNIFFFFLFIILCSPFVVSQGSYSTISTCSEIQDIQDFPSINYRIVNDIDCSGTKFWNGGAGLLPLGDFSGTIDGQGFTIDGLYINTSATGEGDVGLFNSSSGTIENIIFTNVKIVLDGKTGGGLVGSNTGDISTIFMDGDIWFNGLDWAGGFVGRHNDGWIEKIFLDINIHDEFMIFGTGVSGGMIASLNNQSGTGTYPVLTECRIDGEMKVNGTSVGGVLGRNYDGIVNDCYGINSIIAGDMVDAAGGFIAKNDGYITSSYHDGSLTLNTVQAADTIGGFVGVNRNSIAWSYSSCDLVITEGAAINGSFAGLNNATLIKIFSWIDYYTPPLSDQYSCIGNETGTFNDCTFAGDESNFYSYNLEPLSSWDYTDVWNFDGNGEIHSRLIFETEAEFDVVLAEGNLLNCSYPVLFCDDFNYDISMFEAKSWYVFDGDDSLDRFYTPTENFFIMNDSDPVGLSHALTQGFTVNYTYPCTYATLGYCTQYISLFAPSFTNEFTFMINSTETFTDVTMTAYDDDNDECFILRLNGTGTKTRLEFFHYDGVSPAYQNLSDINRNESYRIKISSRFSSENKTDRYRFNSSYEQSHIHIWLNSSQKHLLTGTDDLHEIIIPRECDGIDSFKIEKSSGSTSFMIDDYTFYIGYDPVFLTSDLEMTALTFIDYTKEITDEQAKDDFASSSESIFSTFGLHSAASRTIVSLFLLLLLTLMILGAFLAAKQTPNTGVIVLVDLIFMALLTYIGMLPIWLLILFGFAGVGVGVLWVKFAVLD